MCKVVVLLIKPIAFSTFSLPSPLQLLKLPINLKQRLIVYRAVELILEKATVTLSLAQRQFFEEFPSLIC